MASTAAASAPLDDIMLAMDVVDTLRHRRHLVARELSEDAREAELIDRLREIYRGQGIEVTDDILHEGVKALKENRFAYTPPQPGLGVSLARLYVNRARYARIALIVVLCVVFTWAGWFFGYHLPRQNAAEAIRIEMSETLPNQVIALGEEIAKLAETPDAREKAASFMAAAERALSAQDRDAARAAVGELALIRDELAREYTISIVSRPGELSGVWRIPDANPDAQNFYIIVEALDTAGNPVSVGIRNEENGAIQRVTKWGVRVSEKIFAGVRADKQDDGIIQNALVATKPLGHLEPEYAIPVMGGTITDW
ncbi:DUF6384 family protein [Tepidamorphus sp. 3E244]|uniref:DUF6384 family protein n=1 Tax=Tepidamorphus sp. 3E244 TaxID=3385498 RepID=UPI0038FC565F